MSIQSRGSSLLSRGSSLLISFVVFCAGCGLKQSAPVASPGSAAPLGAIAGSVHGGQQPLAFPHIYVYAVGTGGYGTGSSSLLLPGIGTAKDANGQYYATGDASGNFTLTGQYLCNSGSQVYLYVSGGDPGLGSGSNSAIGLMAALGPCPATGTLAVQQPFVVVNEASTVVAAYALSGFAVDGRHIASSGTTLAQTGVANAMATALNMISVPSGQSPPTSNVGNAMVPLPAIYTLADILAACVNSQGPGSSTCQTLFTNTGGATDTAAAAIAIAHAPFSNVAALYMLTAASAPFQPTLSSAPTDFTVALFYQTPLYQQNLAASDETFVDVSQTAIDSGGNLWMYGDNSNAANPGSVQTHVKYSPVGAVLATTTVPYTISATTNANFVGGSSQLVIDSTDSVWVGVQGGLYRISSQGELVSPATGYNCLGTGFPGLLAIGMSDMVYASDPSGSGIYAITNGGVCQGILQPSAGMEFTGALTMNPVGEVLATDNSLKNVYAFTSASSSSFPAVANWVAADSAGDVWTYAIAGCGLHCTASVLSKFSAGGGPLSPAGGFTGGGLVAPPASATYRNDFGEAPPQFDGTGGIWVLGNDFYGIPNPPLIGHRTDGTPITPSTGLVVPYDNDVVNSISLDGSGNLWVNPADGSLVEFVGLTTPVATPTLYNHLAQRP